MRKFLPTRYYKDIYSINYEKLKEEGIKCLVFDLDNTLAKIDEKEIPKKTYKLIQKLKKEFKVLIITNNVKKRILPYEEKLGIDCVSFALKPSTSGLRRLKTKYKFRKKDIVMIGDQIVTDIFSANRFRIKSILVDPFSDDDMKITKFNRFIEQKIINHYHKKGVFERGKYYE